MWVDYDDGHAGGYPHECNRCTCGHTDLAHHRGRHCGARIAVVLGDEFLAGDLCTCPKLAQA